MKNIIISLVLSAIYISSCYGDHSIQDGLNAISIKLEDGIVLSYDDESMIVADIEKMFAHKKLSTENRSTENDKKIEERGHVMPKRFKNNLGKRSTSSEFFLTEAIIEEYEKAKELKFKWASAYEDLEKFMTDINDSKYLKSLEIEEVRKLFWFSQEEHSWSDDSYYLRNIKNLEKYELCPPSILDFKEGKMGDKSYLLCKLVMRGKKEVFFDKIIIIFDGEKWMFTVGEI